MQAFHGDEAVKAKYLARVDAHIAADELVRGETGRDGKGCAVWCTLNAYEHARYATELGIPEWLARLEDTLFEGMTLEKSRTWPRDFLAAIKPGGDLDKIKGPFLIFVLRRALTRFDHVASPQVKTVVERSIALWERPDVGTDAWREEARAAAARAARAAARAAEATARAAAAAAAAEATARAAEAAAEATARAAEAAEAAAEATAEAAAEATARAARAAEAAEAAEYDAFADGLLRLLATVE